MAANIERLNTTCRLCANIELRFVVHTLRGGALRPVPQWRDGTLPLGYFFVFLMCNGGASFDGLSIFPSLLMMKNWRIF